MRRGPCYPTAVIGLTVGSLEYDIRFINGYYADVFPGNALFPNSVEIVTSLNEVLTSAQVTDLSFAGSSYAREFAIPFSIVGLNVAVSIGFNPFGEWLVRPEALDSLLSPAWYAQPTLVTPVPIPAALPLLASGLSALSFISWRRKRKPSTGEAASAIS